MLKLIYFYTNNWHSVLSRTIEHLELVGWSLSIAIILGMSIAIFIVKRPRFAPMMINIANLLLTVPAIALFALMMPILGTIGKGIGPVPAIIALTLYSLVPIIRNTYTAITSIDRSVIDASKGLGMSAWRILFEVELPIAAPAVISGIHTAAIMNIGFAAIAAYIGAGGLGVLIVQGITNAYPIMILAGAIIVSLLAILVDVIMALAERKLIPLGIQLQSRS